MIEAIDVHAHYGTWYRPDAPPLICDWMSADGVAVAKRAKEVNVTTTVVSPFSGLMPRGQADTVAGNIEGARVTAETEGLLQWVIANPLQPDTFRQVDEMLAQPQCVGIKIHPEEHVYPIRQHGAALFELAAKHNAIVLTHSGDPHSWPQDFVEFANAYANVQLILAHLGNGGAAGGEPTLQVRAIQDCRHGNVYVDTSSARSIVPGLVEWAVQEIGADRILFGSDTPIYSVAMQRARIDSAVISEEAKRMILRENAQKLLGVT